MNLQISLQHVIWAKHDIKNVIVILFLGMCSVAMAAKTVYIYSRNGGFVSFSLDTSTKVTFDSDNIVVEMDDKRISFPFSDYVTFKIEESSGIASIKTNDNEIFCRIQGNELTLRNLAPHSTVRFYSLSGVLLDSSRSDAEGILIYNLGLLSKQVVVVNTANHNLKICF